jgi:hypothetical protein
MGGTDEEHTVILEGIFTVHCWEVSRNEKSKREMLNVADKSVSTPEPVKSTIQVNVEATRNCNQMVAATHKATVLYSTSSSNSSASPLSHSVFTRTPTHRPSRLQGGSHDSPPSQFALEPSGCMMLEIGIRGRRHIEQ